MIRNSFRLFGLNENFATSEWEHNFATEPIWDLINSFDPYIHFTFGKIFENIDILDINYSKAQKLFQLLLKLNKKSFQTNVDSSLARKRTLTIS